MYICECGKQFNLNTQFNGHKSTCKIYLNKLHNDLLIWISEKHTCEKCGKVMTEKYDRGKFCCRSCANSRERSQDVRNKISKSVNSTYNNIKEENCKKYYKNPKHCLNCNNIINYDIRHRKFCSNACENSFRSKRAIENKFGGITKGHGNGISGIYKGIKCDSTYELLYLVYCLDHNICIERNNLFFNYISYDDKIHKFYPDFYLPETKTFIEIKGYYQENTSYKLKAMQEQKVNFKLLYWEDIEYMLEHIKNQYNLSYTSLRKLYD